MLSVHLLAETQESSLSDRTSDKIGDFYEEKHFKIFSAALMEGFFFFVLRESNNCITRNLSLVCFLGFFFVLFSVGFFWCRFQCVEVGFVFHFTQGRKGGSHFRFLPT